MIEKIELDEHKGDILDVVLYRLMQLIDKTNEMIDYLNEQEKNNSCRVNWTHQDSSTWKNIV